ncbi:GMC oxidoreductase [Hyphomonas sp.]|uniref:GMC oxidoreductase n=1 Tax=Hyphomonas sp. TaxID=87 RepID=UPI00391BF90D
MPDSTLWSGPSVESGARFDAIVVGSGAAGGVAAADLCQAGLNVLVLEAGFPAQRRLNPVTTGLSGLARVLDAVGAERRLPPLLARAGEKGFRLLGRARQPVQSRCFAWAMAPGAFVDDRDCSYTAEEGTEFYWFRSRQPGGRMMVPGHGRQYYRLSGMAQGGQSSGEVQWPVSLNDLDPWYARVEARLKLKGGVTGGQRADRSELAEHLQPAEAEAEIIDLLRARWPEAEPAIGNYAAPYDWLGLAGSTGRLTCQAGAVVRRVLRTPRGGVAGVEWFDAATGNICTAIAPIVFLCASAIESTRILLASRPKHGGSTTGTGSPALGAYLMDHAVMSGTGYVPSPMGRSAGPEEPGRCIFLPPHPSIDTRMGFQIHLHPRADGGARVDIVSFAEMLPDDSNRVTIDRGRKDRYGVPQAVIRFRHSIAQHDLAQRQAETIRQIADGLGLTGVSINTALSPGGTSIHECGTARMGTDPETSVLDPDNQCWDMKGLYVTDAAAFPRQHVHNPTLTIMALTARAAAHAAARRTNLSDIAA